MPLKDNNSGGDIDTPPTNPQAMDKKQICKIVLRLVLLFILYRLASVAGTGTALLILLGYGVVCFLLRLCLSILTGYVLRCYFCCYLLC